MTKYFFSGPQGSIPLGPDHLALPFRIGPSRVHPFLTLGDYFKGIEEFVFRDGGKALGRLFREASSMDILPEQIQDLSIFSEKHGALYHLSRVQATAGKLRVDFCVTTALGESKAWLVREFEVLRLLERSFHPPCLPKPFFAGEIHRAVGEDVETFSMLASQWFTGFHEWHLSMDKIQSRPKVHIWDQEGGYRFASREETFELFRQAARILTLYYDTQDFRQISPWHHGAGDFVINCTGGSTQVRLTTARNYRPLMVFPAKHRLNPLLALIYFFLNLTVKMRLDKLDGTGQTAWAEETTLKAATVGFFEALQMMEAEGRYGLGKPGDLHALLKSFGPQELGTLFNGLADLYQEEDPSDLLVIQKHWGDHIKGLFEALQDRRL